MSSGIDQLIYSPHEDRCPNPAGTPHHVAKVGCPQKSTLVEVFTLHPDAEVAPRAPSETGPSQGRAGDTGGGGVDGG